MTVAVLFARSDSHYKANSDCDVFDIERDARTWNGGCPVIAHPPCRAWGKLKHFAKPRSDEKELALFAVQKVRENGGVLEHPEGSSLWKEAGLPMPGKGKDSFGGWSIALDQSWFGHRAIKRTILYVVGLEPAQLPKIEFALKGDFVPVEKMGKAERERTPERFAEWLIELARRVA